MKTATSRPAADVPSVPSKPLSAAAFGRPARHERPPIDSVSLDTASLQAHAKKRAMSKARAELEAVTVEYNCASSPAERQRLLRDVVKPVVDEHIELAREVLRLLLNVEIAKAEASFAEHIADALRRRHLILRECDRVRALQGRFDALRFHDLARLPNEVRAILDTFREAETPRKIAPLDSQHLT